MLASLLLLPVIAVVVAAVVFVLLLLSLATVAAVAAALTLPAGEGVVGAEMDADSCDCDSCAELPGELLFVMLLPAVAVAAVATLSAVVVPDWVLPATVAADVLLLLTLCCWCLLLLLLLLLSTKC